MKLSVLIVGSRDDSQQGWQRCQSLAAELAATGHKVRCLNKLSSNLEDLTLVARYRVVATPSVLILLDDQVVYRRRSLCSASSILAALNMFQHGPIKPDPTL